MKLIIIIVLSFLLCGCKEESSDEYIKRRSGIDVSNCTLEEDNDSHGGFLGDGESLIIYECSNKPSKIEKELPLSNNLELIMYGGEYKGVTYSYNLASNNNIPEITNGYYYFLNRQTNIEYDDDIFDKYSFNFTLVLYDNSSNKLYYYEFDT